MRVLVLRHEPGVAELAHGVDDRQQRLAFRREHVLDAGWHLGVAVPLHDRLLLELAEPLGQRAWADARARPLELGEAARAFREVVEEQRGPLGADDVRAARDRARLVVDLLHRAHRHDPIVDACDACAQSQGGGLCTQRPPTMVATTLTSGSSDGSALERIPVEHDEVGEVARAGACRVFARRPRATPARRSLRAEPARP